MAIERITLNQRKHGVVMQNVFHVLNSDGFMTPAQIAEEVRLNWIANITLHQAHGLVYESVTITRVGEAQPPAPITIPYVNVDGNGTNTLHHSSICMLLSFRTQFAGRRYRGRYYIATCPWAYTTDDVLNSNGTAAMQSIVDPLQARWAQGGNGPLGLVIYHRDVNEHTLVKNIIFSSRVGIQRRRNVGVGI